MRRILPLGLALATAGAALLCAAPASADSISFLRGGDIWVASPDGSRQVQVTHDGGYAHQSQADDGRFIALKGRRLHLIARDGRVLADFDTPVSGERTDTTSSYFRGPYEPEISPDGKTVAYEYYFTAIENKPGCLPLGDPSCQRREVHAGVGYTHSDRQTGWEEPGLGRQSGWMDPSWAPDGSVLLSDKTRRPNLDIMVDRLGDGNQVIQGWFEDTGVWYFRQAEMNRQGTALVAVTTRPKSVNEPLYEDDQVTIYRLNGAPPVLPESCYFYAGPDGRYFSPTWSPDGTRIAYNNNGASHERRDILVGEVPSQAGGCVLPAAGASVVIEGAEFPDWGPADVPGGSAPAPAPSAPAPATPTAPASRPPAPGGDGPRGPSLSVRRVRLRAALATGLTVRATGVRGRRVRLVARRGRTVVARGAARTDARGRATIRLRFTAAARRSLRGTRRVSLVVTGAGPARTVVLER